MSNQRHMQRVGTEEFLSMMTGPPRTAPMTEKQRMRAERLRAKVDRGEPLVSDEEMQRRLAALAGASR